MSLTLEEITHKALIKFPWRITIEQSLELMKYIGFKMQGIIEYEFLHSIKIGHEFGYSKTLNEEKILNTKGKISLSTPPFTSDNFSFKPSENESSSLCAIQFFVPRDFEKIKYDFEKVQLWGETRKQIESYFEENPEEH